MKSQNLFKWKHLEGEMILQTVRWYWSYSLSLRNIAEMMEERGFSIAHPTIMRWVHEYGPQLGQRLRRHLKLTNDSWKVDETYIKIKGNGDICIVPWIPKEARLIFYSVLDGIEKLRNASSVRLYGPRIRNPLEPLRWIKMRLILLPFENDRQKGSYLITVKSNGSNI
jgi:hypothetical protein